MFKGVNDCNQTHGENIAGGDVIKTLVKRSKKGDKDAFVALIDMNRSALYNTAVIITKNEQDALDAISEAVLSCWENIPFLKNESNFKTWLTRIVINKCYDIIRDRSHFAFVEGHDEGRDEDKSTRLEVEEYLERLNYNEKLVLTLFYFDDYSIKQISEILGISQAAVKTRLNRSRNRFKEMYMKDEKVAVYEK